MEKFVINGPTPLNGEVTISGAKNAVVAIIPATILAKGICRIENIPNISDVTMIIRTLQQLGAKIKMINSNVAEIDTSHITSHVVPYEMTKHLRASYYLIGALLGAYGEASVAMPGGCDFGTRPIDQHIKGFETLGADVQQGNSVVNAKAKNLHGTQVYLDVVSVGATINVMLAAVMAKGMTIIENSAKEPHIVDLANFLNSCGANIRGAGTDTIKIIGVEKMHGCTYSIIPDQIEAGTYMVAAAASGGDVLIKNVIPKHLESITAKLAESGVEVEEFDDSVRVTRNGDIKKCNVKTMPHPGFPTDMQPQIVAMLSVANGASVVSESVWDNRFRYTKELVKMGAKINAEGKLAQIEGVSELQGACVRATDLRAGAALMIAGLCANGKTEIEDVRFIERGYEDVINKFNQLGADIKCVFVPNPDLDK